MKQWLLISFSILLAIVPLNAQTTTIANALDDGNYLQSANKCIERMLDGGQLTADDFKNVSFLLGYYRGIAAMHSAYASLSSKYPESYKLLFRLPDNVTDTQICKIVSKYLNDNPDKLNLRGDVIVLTALRDAFPP